MRRAHRLGSGHGVGALLLPLLLSACDGARKPGETGGETGDSALDSAAHTAETAADDTAPADDTSDTSDTSDTFDTSHSGDSGDTGCFATTWYADRDHDDYGDEATAEHTCEPTVENPVLAGGDCDDTNPDVHPDAEEICNDGLDNDCDGASPCGLDGVVLVESADLRVVATDHDLLYGYTLVALDDLDADDLPDLVVGAPGVGPDADLPGSAWTLTELDSGYADEVGVPLDGASVYSGFGTALADAGDRDGDGLSDLWVSAPRDRTHGTDAFTIYLFESPTAPTDSRGAAAAMWGEAGLGGGSGLAAGDLDGDTIPDVATGSANAGDDGEGTIFLGFGASLGTGPLSEQAVGWVGEARGDGAEPVAVGDLDGDGQDDLVVGAPTAQARAGRTYVVHGPILGGGDLSDADLVLTGEGALDASGGVVAVLADLDGDGGAELGVSALSHPSGAATGRVYVHSGGSTGARSQAEAWLSLTGVMPEDRLGGTLTTGDVDGDGAAELYTGSDHPMDADGHVGVVYGLRSPRGGELLAGADTDAELWGSVGEGLGTSLAATDLDGDGFDELIVGSARPGYAGMVYILFGGVP